MKEIRTYREIYLIECGEPARITFDKVSKEKTIKQNNLTKGAYAEIHDDYALMYGYVAIDRTNGYCLNESEPMNYYDICTLIDHYL